jgi:hypothetical protein
VSTHDQSDQGSVQSSQAADQQPTGLLYVAFEYPIDGLEEMNDWYNGEHIPERMSVPGFEAAHRYVAVEGSPRWLATYELSSPAVLETPAYRRFHGPDETAWTRRVLLPSRPSFRRGVYELIWSDRTSKGESGPAGPPGLLTLHFSATQAEPAATAATESDLGSLLASPGVSRVRFYRDFDAVNERLFLADLDSIWAVQGQQFRHTWNRLTARLADQSVAFVRTVQVIIL